MKNNFSFIDLTHSITSDIPHWNEGCGFKKEIMVDYSGNLAETQFRVERLFMSAGIGTHMDAPVHCFPGAESIDTIPLKKLIVPCVVVDVSAKATETYRVTPDDIHAFEEKHRIINPGEFVIVYTGWDKFWSHPQKYRNNYVFPAVSEETAKLLVERNISGLGIDTLSPDRANEGFLVHRVILGAGKYIIENIHNANHLPPTGSTLFALPMKIKEGTEAPIRLIASV